MNQYTHRYSLTAADMDTRYRMTPKAIRCLTIHWLKETFLGDTLTCRLNLLPNETDEPVYHYLHTLARNDAETAAQIYSEWIPRSEQIDVSVHAPRK